MRKIYTIIVLATVLLAAGILSCSENDAGLPTYEPPPPDYIPTVEGTTWTYDVKLFGGPYENYRKIETVKGTSLSVARDNIRLQ